MDKLTHPLDLPPPAGGQVDLLFVVGEHSGDENAARVLRDLRARQPGLRVCALGGPHLAAAGAQLLRDLTAESAMGFAVVTKLAHYRKLIADIVDWIGRHRPRAVCFVDSSGLNLRIAAGLHARGFSAKAGGPTKALYYISPQIWASRAGRRFQMAAHLDGLAAIFPFEPAVYADTDLPVEFVGHPFLAPDYVPPVAFDPAGPVLLLPGSRRGVVQRIFPLLLAAYRASGPTRPAVVLYPSEDILAVLRAANPPAGVTLRRTGATDGPVRAAAVLTASGTMSMHCALAGIPGALTYKTDLITYLLGRLLVKVEFIGIANLLLKEAMYPEFIQGAATPAALAAQLRECLQDPARAARTAAQRARLRALLAQPASGTAADWLARQLGPS
ncbi:lipid-A-disaccharide synthase [Opitutus sp. GAS368]|uniref:lipid-A-disaccharide synthase n=1 Tax=Opitutus sp. GAS368 TaxID=1882749 RepID=UPI000879CC09|nr:lipid-A-disaccharide synthase [Opitutus sp. GAS368]SDR70405.1 lipid-A-disaccharide synthase [Opitutus sp. GAS368]